MQAPTDLRKEQNVAFDTDSAPIGIDNRCSGCISHKVGNFIGELKESSSRAIKGIGGTQTTGLKMGTIVWRWSDNEGRIHKFHIPYSYYVLQGEVRLLSPQHWAKTQKDYKPILKGTGSETNSKNIILY
eukprot:scaffold50569_cov62-Attheya_sp.AAC.1